MKKIEPKVKLIVFVLAAVMSFGTYSAVALADVTIGTKAPEFDLKDNADNELKSANVRGKVVVLVYATRGSAETVDAWHFSLKETHKENENVVIVSVANLIGVPSFITEEMMEMMLAKDHKTPVFMDWEGKLADALGVSSAKQGIVILDKRLIVKAYYDDLTPECTETISSLLKE